MAAINIIRIVLSVLLALLLAATGGGKLAGAASSVAIRDSLQVSASRWKAIGLFEYAIAVALVVGLWLPAVGIAGAVGVVVLMVGAIVTRVSAGGEQQKRGVQADAIILVLGAAAAVLGVLTAM